MVVIIALILYKIDVYHLVTASMLACICLRPTSKYYCYSSIIISLVFGTVATFDTFLPLGVHNFSPRTSTAWSADVTADWVWPFTSSCTRSTVAVDLTFDGAV